MNSNANGRRPVYVWIAVGLAICCNAIAAPRVPSDPATVLERLPSRPTDPAAREIRAMRDELARDPGNQGIAARLARRYFRLAMAEGDPRYIGYGEAVLRPWWRGEAPEAETLYARALLKQYKHDFGAALDDLAAAANKDPADEAIWSWRVALHLVRADYAAARADCGRIGPAASRAQCLAWVDGTTGRAAAAYASMQRAYASDRDAGAGGRLWTLTRLAELAERVGDDKAAEDYFKQAQNLGVTDQFLLAAYADFLLDRGRAAEVATLLKDWVRSDILLLRLALAEKATGAAGANGRIATLKARFEAAAARGDKLHQQEESRFNLELAGDASRALALATENWAKQKEPRDARVLLEAALATNDRAAAAGALDWLRSSGFEDKRLRSLAARLDSGNR